MICSTSAPPCIIGPLEENFSSHNRLYYQNQGHLLLVPSVYRITGAVIPVKSPDSMHAIRQYILSVEDEVTGMSSPSQHNSQLVTCSPMCWGFLPLQQILSSIYMGDYLSSWLIEPSTYMVGSNSVQGLPHGLNLSNIFTNFFIYLFSLAAKLPWRQKQTIWTATWYRFCIYWQLGLGGKLQGWFSSVRDKEYIRMYAFVWGPTQKDNRFSFSDSCELFAQQSHQDRYSKLMVFSSSPVWYLCPQT